MGYITSIDRLDHSQKKEILRINRHKAKIMAILRHLKFRDNTTKQYVIYIPSLEITGYGKTVAKADEMLREALNNYFDHIIHFSSDKLQQELRSLGWIKNKTKSKEFSNTSVDARGKLQGFDVNPEQVEEGVLALT